MSTAKWVKLMSERLEPEVINVKSCSTQLSMEVFRLINVKMPLIVGIQTSMSRKNTISGLFEPEKSGIS